MHPGDPYCRYASQVGRMYNLSLSQSGLRVWEDCVQRICSAQIDPQAERCFVWKLQMAQEVCLASVAPVSASHSSCWHCSLGS